MQKRPSAASSLTVTDASVTAVLPVTATNIPVGASESAQSAEETAVSGPVGSSALVPPARFDVGMPRRTRLAEALPAAANSDVRSLRPRLRRVSAQPAAMSEDTPSESSGSRSHTPRQRRMKRGMNVVEAARESTPHRQAEPKHPAISHRGGGEEDTFAAHPQPRHADSGEEWTDKIP